jgi:hypothetical protein
MLFTISGGRTHVAERQAIDWSFFSMARYLLTADPADPSVLPGSAWDGFLRRLAEAGTLAAQSRLPAAAVDRASACRGATVNEPAGKPYETRIAGTGYCHGKTIPASGDGQRPRRQARAA